MAIPRIKKARTSVANIMEKASRLRVGIAERRAHSLKLIARKARRQARNFWRHENATTSEFRNGKAKGKTMPKLVRKDGKLKRAVKTAKRKGIMAAVAGIAKPVTWQGLYRKAERAERISLKSDKRLARIQRSHSGWIAKTINAVRGKKPGT